MKALLLKDFYMALKHCRTYLLIVIVFFAVSFVSSENLFFMIYPVVLVGMIPLTLVSYEEMAKWTGYCLTLPYERKTIVTEKYVLGLCLSLVMVVISACVCFLNAKIMKFITFDVIGQIAFYQLAMALLSPAISMPFVFKLGSEKGRIANFLMIGIVCGGSALAMQLFSSDSAEAVTAPSSLPYLIFFVIAFAIYVFSWFLSVRFYEKREF